MKLVAEYRRRVLAVKTLIHSALTPEEASELRKIAMSWEHAARLREEYLKANASTPHVPKLHMPRRDN